MKDKRSLLYALLAASAFLLWNQWSVEHASIAPPAAAASELQSSQDSAAIDNGLPPESAINRRKKTETGAPPEAHEMSSKLVTITTDVMVLKIDPKGGNVVSAKLTDYPKALHSPDDPVEILSGSAEDFHVAQSGLLGPTGPDTRQGQTTYQVSANSHTLLPGKQTLDVDLTWSQGGLDVIKRFTLQRGQYSVAVKYLVNNRSGQPWTGNAYAQIRRKKHTEAHHFLGLNTYAGGAISSAAKPYEKITDKNMEKTPLSRDIEGGWVAMQQRYFLSAWISEPTAKNHYFSRVNDGVYTLGFIGPALKVLPGQTLSHTNKLYVGPELEPDLVAAAPHLKLTIDYGWLWMISSAIFWVMKHIYALLGNWGWSIILVTLFIKLLFYKLSEKSYISMAKMRTLAPRMEQLKKRHADDKAKLSQATMELYKKEKINPLGGCLPMVVQIPVFIALYYVLIESVSLRHAPFILWIQDLSSKDPYAVLPILMGASMFVQQFLNPPPPDKTQEMMMKFGLPVMFTVLFWTFPAGLVLYWLVNNVLSILQQWYIMKKFDDSSKPLSIKK